MRYFAQDGKLARAQLLALKGIGPETADAILLYSGRHPVFVADAYTRRILSRHELISPSGGLRIRAAIPAPASAGGRSAVQ